MSQDDIDVLKRQINDIHELLLGSYSQEGLISRLVELEKFKKSTENFLKIVIGVITALIIAYLKMSLKL